jgi:DNA-binding CsgD family transcriptional regulator
VVGRAPGADSQAWLLVELAHILRRRGRCDDALEALERLRRRAADSPRQWVQADAARCQGLLADDGAFDEPFARAVELSRAAARLTRARVHLGWGERLLASGRTAEGRERLQEALALFDALGAAPWSARARRQLAGGGEPSRPRLPSLREALTGQELQVVLVVGEGLRNREAAARLFVTEKTIEFHLSNIYRKLGVSNRTEAARYAYQHGLVPNPVEELALGAN